MGYCVCGGAIIRCSFGMTPAVLNVLPNNKAVNIMPIANIMDNKPLVNIMPFGMCQSLANPTVASATSAALGVLTPMPCIPLISAPWSTGSPTVLLANIPILNNTSKLICSYGGVIEINSAGQQTIQVP